VRGYQISDRQFSLLAELRQGPGHKSPAFYLLRLLVQNGNVEDFVPRGF
jgi:hypothetical protein